MKSQTTSALTRLFALILTVSALSLSLGALLASSPASAAEPINDRLTDVHGFLNDEETTRVNERLDRALSEGINLYVVITDDFGGTNSTDWCVATAQQSDVPDSAVLYVLATQQRRYALCQGATAPVSSTRVAQAGDNAASQLSANPLDGASVVAGIDILSTDLARAASDSSTTSDSNTSGSSSSAGVSPLLIVFVLGLVGAIIVFVVAKIQSSRKQANFAQTAAHKLEQAGVDLMKADDEVRAAGEDLAFARAQFGELKTEQFADALKKAEDYVAQAFVIQKEAEAAGTEVQKVQLAERISDLTNKVKSILASHTEQFQQLRDLESNVDQSISNLRVRINEAKRNNQRARAEIESLKLTYRSESLKSILDNPDQADNLLAASSDALDEATKYLPDQRSEALFHVNLAQRAFGQAMNQIQEVMDASDDLAQARQRLTQAIASISSDLDDVSRLASDDTAFTPLVADARAAIAAGNAAREGQGDQLAALSHLRNAEDALDTALDPLRDREEQRSRRHSKLVERFDEVDEAIKRADVYLSSSRGVASKRSRSLVAEAKRHRDDAARIYRDDQEKAFDLLRQAKAEAQASIDDVFTGRQMHPAQQSGGIDLGTLILGGILFGGGGSGGSSRSSGSSWGSSSGWGSSGGFSGGFGGGWSSSGSGSF
ncbi:MAG: TPM domain-containing protein [Actinomycetaceae bacterium]|nr:TPM domain-containing protein [Actinomycetaceae bacterium]